MFFECTQAQFAPRWENPRWTALELDWEGEAEQIGALLQQLLARLPTVQVFHRRVQEDDVLLPEEMWQVQSAVTVRALSSSVLQRQMSDGGCGQTLTRMGVVMCDGDLFRRLIMVSLESNASFHYGILGPGSDGLACKQARARVLLSQSSKHAPHNI